LTPLAVPEFAPQLLLGIDIGSSGLKAVLLDPARGIEASQRYDVALYTDHSGWAEADTGEWWRALCAVVPKLLSDANATNVDVAGVAVSGMVPAVICLDESGRVVRRAILQSDARATHEIREIGEKLDDLDLLGLTGSVLSQQSVAPTALWLARHEPDVWATTRFIVGSYDWMAYALGAESHVEHNWAIESGLYKLDTEPLSAVQEATGVAWPTLLGVKQPGDVVGEVSAKASEATGLRAGTPIVVGGADHVLSAYGAGLVHEGEALLKLGGSMDILVVSDEIFLDSRLYLDRHPISGKWIPNGCTATSGSLLRWEQSIFDHVALDELDHAAAMSQPGALLALPFFLGEKTPLHDPDLRGGLLGLNLTTTRGDIHRSFLEGIAYSARLHFEVFKDRGLDLRSIRITNGGSKSRLWREILADVLNRDLTSVIDHPGASYAAAVIAGIGTGLITDWSYVISGLEEGETISPNLDYVALYDERYHQYLEFSDVTTDISHALVRDVRTD
jgi:xylulokinase